MSETQEHIDGRTREARAMRADQVQGERRRRRHGTLNRMAQFKLDCIEPEDLDLENYVYRWVNDQSSRIRQLTKQDDYDFVTLDELGDGFDKESTDTESTGRVRMLVGGSANNAPIYAYLLKKRRAFWDADNMEMAEFRQAQMEQRVYQGVETESDARGDTSNRYVAAGARLATQGPRRRGPVQRL